MSQSIVEMKLNKLNMNKASGIERIHPSLLRELSEELSGPLSILFRRTLDEGTVPTDWRAANVTPLYKKGNKSTPGNYRPVSLTSVVCKLLESIIKDAIMEHLEKHKLINISQHGFLPGRSCLTNLLAYLESVTKHVDSRLPVDILYLDFAKTFDKVPHIRLLMKLKVHGIDGVVLEWIRRWLTDRKQRVILNGGTSDWFPAVSQGSVLGPSLFRIYIYINDIDLNIFTDMLKFANDTKVICPIEKEENGATLQADLDKLLDWSNKWQMQFKIEKCTMTKSADDVETIHSRSDYHTQTSLDLRYLPQTNTS